MSVPEYLRIAREWSARYERNESNEIRGAAPPEKGTSFVNFVSFVTPHEHAQPVTAPPAPMPKAFPCKGAVILVSPPGLREWARAMGYPKAGMMRTADGELFITTDVPGGLRRGTYDVLAVPRSPGFA